MVVTVIITVLILAFVVSGYWVNSDFQIERQGLLQIYSIPTGADVNVDGNPSSWLQRTNTSKTLAAGEHTISLSKDGYDTWSRTVNITEGLLYRLHYPRLFLKNRTKETALEFSANSHITNAYASPDRNWILVSNNSTSWQLLNLDTDNIKTTSLDLSGILPLTNPNETSIASADWANDNEHILLSIYADDSHSPESLNWLLLNVKNPASSVNLTKDFNANFTKVEILDSSASGLLAVLNGNLHQIDVASRRISAVLVSDIQSFDHYNREVIFSAKKSSNIIKNSTTSDKTAEETNSNSEDKSTTEPYFVGLLQLGSDKLTILKSTSTPEQVLATKFYDDIYICTVADTTLKLYQKNNFEEKSQFALSFYPENYKVGAYGEAIVMSSGGHILSLDMEASALTDWSTNTDKFGWLDGSMLYTVDDGNLNVYDFNGLNHRVLSSNVSARFPITITSDKYLYYFSDGQLIREYLYEK